MNLLICSLTFQVKFRNICLISSDLLTAFLSSTLPFSLSGGVSLCYACAVSQISMTQNRAFKFQTLNLAMKLDVVLILRKIEVLMQAGSQKWMENNENINNSWI